MAVFTFFYAIETIFVLSEILDRNVQINWNLAKIFFCTIEGVAMAIAIFGFVLLIVWFTVLFKQYDQFDPMKTSLITFCSIVIFIQVLRLIAYAIY